LLLLTAARGAPAEGADGAQSATTAAQAPGSGKAEERVDNKTGLAFLQLPGGPFHLGCEPADTACKPDEQPGKETAVKSYWLGKTEVTTGAYEKCVRAGACTAAATGNKCNAGPAKEAHPANCVSWEQAKRFCEWIDARLPTAEEWEYAAKGGTARVFPWGNEPPTEETIQFAAKEGTSAVGVHPKGASRHGVQDLAGNVWEWTGSDYDDDNKEVRGGGWQLKVAKYFRASIRYKCPASSFNDNIGFRCAQ
jgi:formylglycine-generating enzyme required for sulfatase activity